MLDYVRNTTTWKLLKNLAYFGACFLLFTMGLDLIVLNTVSSKSWLYGSFLGLNNATCILLTVNYIYCLIAYALIFVQVLEQSQRQYEKEKLKNIHFFRKTNK